MNTELLQTIKIHSCALQRLRRQEVGASVVVCREQFRCEDDRIVAGHGLRVKV